MRAAPQPKIPATTMTQARARGCSAQHVRRFYFIYYVLCYFNLSLIITPYHNEPRSPSAQTSLNHDEGTRAQLLGPNFTHPQWRRFLRAAAQPNIYYVFYLI